MYLSGHYLTEFRSVPTIVLWRDPRDIVVSWYYHTLTSNVSHPIVKKHALDHLHIRDLTDIRTNLPDFIDYMFTDQKVPKFTWVDFFNQWHENNNAFHTSYERLSDDPSTELAKICSYLKIDSIESEILKAVTDHSFEAKSGRRQGVSDNSNFMRKGVKGDWQNCFTEEATTRLKSKIDHRLEWYTENFS